MSWPCPKCTSSVQSVGFLGFRAPAERVVVAKRAFAYFQVMQHLHPILDRDTHALMLSHLDSYNALYFELFQAQRTKNDI